MAAYAIETSDLTKKFGRATALDKVNLHLTRGTIYGLVGQSGAGKSTLLRVVSGLQQPTEGEYRLFERHCTDPDIGIDRRRVGVVMNGGTMVPSMSLRMNLQRQCSLLGVPGSGRADEVLELTGLKDCADTKTEELTGEKAVIAAIAIALCGSPDLLLLDDVYTGIGSMQKTDELLQRLKQELEITILVTAQEPEMLAGVAEKYGVMDHGVLRRELSAEEMKQMQETALRIHVSDTNALARVMVAMSLRHRILNADTAEIYGKPNITELVVALADEGCKVLSMEETSMQTESLLQALNGGEV